MREPDTRDKQGQDSRAFSYLDLDTFWDNEAPPLEKKMPNELGIYNMCGSVLEWCQDTYGKYSSSNQINPCMNDPSFSQKAFSE